MEKIKRKISGSDWLLIWLLSFAGQLTWAIENNTFATYATTVTGSALVVTLMVDLSALFSMVATFISGTLTDRRGRRRKAICIGFILWGLFTVVFGLADFIPKKNTVFLGFYLVLMDSVMSFFGSFGYSGGFNAWTTDISDESNRGSVATITSAVTIIANIVIVGLQGALISAFGFLPIFVGMGVLVTLFGLLAMAKLKDSQELQPSVTREKFWSQLFENFNFKETFSNRGLLWALLVICVYTLGFNVYMSYSMSYLYYYFPEWTGIALSKANGSYIYGGALLVATAVSVLFIKPINSGKAKEVAFFSVALTVVALVCLSFAKTIPTLIIFICLSSLGYITNLESTGAWFKNECPVNKRGSIEGVRQIFYNVIPMCLGTLIAYIVIKLAQVTVVVDGVAIEAPTNHLFLIAGIVTLFTFIPLGFAVKAQKK